ncbi:hypothetical protein Q31b_15190 [Novipirellula aureliae]|uniref:Uncharacterized protein n=1 Tax=Novipirellula aureliae TaxID=2527966 RepID=A0A5C6E5K8_9BACT|nr:hypothetical protein [Novipirellula aureliae]TWU43985.1 hypothetical protein Q31b_15190 [Novipirellula aureliae]
MSIKKIIREANWLVPRLGLQGIALHEIGSSGFGDRLRGISLALFLARYHRVRRIYYNDFEGDLEDHRWVIFKHKLCDLIQLDGIELIETPLPFPEKTLCVEHLCHVGTGLKRYGWRQMWRLQPRSPAIRERIDDIGIDQTMIGFHVRATDMVSEVSYARGEEVIAAEAIENLGKCAAIHGTRKVFLAADNQKGRDDWGSRLTDLGFSVKVNAGTVWNENAIRHTGVDDMLVDFFGLANCCRVVRLVSSEFSRHAAWMTGRPLRYSELL